MYRFLAQIKFNNPLPNQGNDGAPVLQQALTLALGLLGSISVLVIILSGIRLMLSRGNPDAIAKLRSTIIYAFIGLAVSILAGSIVGLVINRT